MASPYEKYDAAVKQKDEGNLEAAVALLEENAKEFPDHCDTHSALAVYMQRIGRFEDALLHANKVCELAPDDTFSYTQLSVVCMKCGKIEEAEDAKAKAHEVAARR